MNHEPIKVCKEHQVFSEGCAVCQLLFDRAKMVRTFWFIAMCCEAPYSGGAVATQLQPLKTILTTNEKAKTMKGRLEQIKGIANDMVGQYGDPEGQHKPWPRPRSTMR